ncbi:MAG: CAP domain-containing protein [Filifactor alocis]|nr:CAP domain-containing protein [Filifactor alocis]
MKKRIAITLALVTLLSVVQPTFAQSKPAGKNTQSTQTIQAKQGAPAKPKEEVYYIKDKNGKNKAIKGTLADITGEMLPMINKLRAGNNVAGLKASDNKQVIGFTKVRAVELAELFSHSRPYEGAKQLTLSSLMLEENKIGAVGENIAAGYTTVEKAFVGWSNSEGHRENMLSKDFKKVSIYRFNASSKSEYGVYYIQVFTD